MTPRHERAGGESAMSEAESNKKVVEELWAALYDRQLGDSFGRLRSD